MSNDLLSGRVAFVGWHWLDVNVDQLFLLIEELAANTTRHAEAPCVK